MDYSIDEVLEFIEENDVKFIRLAFVDIFGNHKNQSILPRELPKAFEEGISFDSFLVLGYNDTDQQDLYLVPDPSTLNILPWRPQQGRVIRFYCNVVTADGEPFRYNARHFLQETIKTCKKEFDFQVRIGLKTEFYLFKTDENGNPTDQPWDNGSYLDIAPLDRGENIRREICLCLEEMGLNPQSSHHEQGPGQNEIDFAGGDALSAADNFITYKNVVSNIAGRNGVYASFSPKPLPEESGSGLHMKLALYRKGENLIESQPEICNCFMAGVLKHIRELTVFLNNSVESYQRFGLNEAPRYVTWSNQNRSRLIRVPVNKGKADYFVLRSPDPMMNPYLAFAMVIQAGLDGIRNSMELPAPVEINGRDLTGDQRNGCEMLPMSFAEAVQVAGDSEFLADFAGKDLVAYYISLLKKQLQ